MTIMESEFRKLEKEEDGRKNNGGARKGAGRPLSPVNLAILEYMNEDVIVKEFKHGQIRRIKKKRLEELLDQLVELGLKGNVRAIRAYFDITIGRPVIHKEPKKPKRKPTPEKIFCPALKLAQMEYEKLKN
jgi:hypothetical protein